MAVSEDASFEGREGSPPSAGEWARTGRACLIVATVVALAALAGSLGSAFLAVGFALLGMLFLSLARRSAFASRSPGQAWIRAAGAALALLGVATVIVIIMQL
jgi:hypothetical protein